MIVVIPARYASTRLPGKPLADIHGKPLVQHVYEAVQQSSASRVVIATDDARIVEAARSFDAEVLMTRADHQSGTDRIAEVIQTLQLPDDEVVVNVQGDEPMMPAALVNQVGALLEQDTLAPMATACHGIDAVDELLDPNIVKVVTDRHGYALYLSRAPIPYNRALAGQSTEGCYRHIGIYAYRAGFVSRYAAWPACPLELLESLEQLRVLWHGQRIITCVANELPGPGVDTPQDLERVRVLMS